MSFGSTRHVRDKTQDFGNLLNILQAICIYMCVCTCIFIHLYIYICICMYYISLYYIYAYTCVYVSSAVRRPQDLHRQPGLPGGGRGEARPLTELEPRKPNIAELGNTPQAASYIGMLYMILGISLSLAIGYIGISYMI